jgi:hypothetical protein
LRTTNKGEEELAVEPTPGLPDILLGHLLLRAVQMVGYFALDHLLLRGVQMVGS